MKDMKIHSLTVMSVNIKCKHYTPVCMSEPTPPSKRTEKKKLQIELF